MDYLHQRGVRVLLQDDYTIAAVPITAFAPRSQPHYLNDLENTVIRLAVGAPDVTTYLISPKIGLDYARRDIPQLAGFGDGWYLSIGLI